MASDLEKICQDLLATFKDSPALVSELQSQSRILDHMSAEVEQVTRSSSMDMPAGVINSLHQASRDCKMIAEHLHRAEAAAEAFVNRAVGGAYSPSGGSANSVDSHSTDQQAITTSGSAASIEQIQAWLPEVNVGFTGLPRDPRSLNCGNCALAVFGRLNGSSDSVAGLATLSPSQMEAATGVRQIGMSPSEIAQRLIDSGPGSHAVVGVDRKNRPGHWFNAYFDGERVVAIDGQSGRILGWPPDYGYPDAPVVYWDAGFSHD